MVPPSQRLELDHLSGPRGHNGLEDHRDFAARDGQLQPRFHLRALHQGSHHVRMEAQEAVLAGSLGRVHGDVRLTQQFGSDDRFLPDGGEPQAQARPQHRAVDGHGHVQAADDAFGDGIGVGAGRQQHHKLVAPEPGHDVGGGNAAAEPAGHFHQHVIAGQVPQDVVDFLEIVQVNEQDIDSLQAWFGEGPSEGLVEHCPVGQPGQRVLEGKGPQLLRLGRQVGQGLLGLFLRLPARSDIAEAPHPACDPLANALGPRIPFERPAILEVQHVVALCPRVLHYLGEPGHEGLRIGNLGDDQPHDGLVTVAVREIRRDAPHFQELVVEPGDSAIGADHQDAVRGGFEGGCEQGHGLAEVSVRIFAVLRAPDRNQQNLPAAVVQQ